MLAALTPCIAGVKDSVVEVFSNDKPVALGAVVRKDGYILTKASELNGGNVTCKIGGRELPAKIVKNNDSIDLAMLKVEATDLDPVEWASGEAPPRGTWVVVPGTEGQAMALGIVSIAARPIPKSPVITQANTAALGAYFERSTVGIKVREVKVGGPADKAGLKAGDVITAAAGTALANSAALVELIGKFKPGDKITLDVKRGDQNLQFTAVLEPANTMRSGAAARALRQLRILSKLSGGTVSERSSGFSTALTHDAVIQASHCGGPVVDLHGRVVGLNIARADRSATYALPANALRPLVAEMIGGTK